MLILKFRFYSTISFSRRDRCVENVPVGTIFRYTLHNTKDGFQIITLHGILLEVWTIHSSRTLSCKSSKSKPTLFTTYSAWANYRLSTTIWESISCSAQSWYIKFWVPTIPPNSCWGRGAKTWQSLQSLGHILQHIIIGISGLRADKQSQPSSSAPSHFRNARQ